MALSTHAGGAADKAGNVHEALWGARALRYVLEGEAESIRIEEPGEDGAEFYLQKSGYREYWQLKRQVSQQKTWSFTSLESVLAYFVGKVREGHRCVFASVSDAPELRVLIENAKAAEDFAEFNKEFQSEKRRKELAELRKTIGLKSDEEAFDFLTKIEVHGGRENTLEPEFGLPLEIRFHGPWQATLDLLKNLYFESSHESLTAEDIESHLSIRGIQPRHSSASITAVEGVTQTYLSGQKAKLIKGNLIPREIACETIDRVTNSKTSLDVLITGDAGGGKSACIYQIVEGLKQAGFPILSFRLDRIEPTPSTNTMGQSLGFDESPSLCLTTAYSGRPVALVIDQLDCVSSTSGRHPDFFDTVAALRDELVGLREKQSVHLIMTCRKFDFFHDHRFRNLLASDTSPISLGKLNESEVSGVLSAEGGDYSRLTPKQRELLELPQNLALYIEAGLAQSENKFTTTKELYDAYWSVKRKTVASQDSEYDQFWVAAIHKLSSAMSERQELSVPVRTLDEFSQAFLDTMTSEGVFATDGHRYGFGHESFFDYCFARTQPNDGRDFVSSLESDDQHLFRRAQLRQVLAFLRDDDFDAYQTSVSQVLESAKIRTHLKTLVVELIGAHPDARDEEFDLLKPAIESEWNCRGSDARNTDKMASRIWDRFFVSRTLFPVADRVGLIDEWLKSECPASLDTVVHYLRWQTEEHAERVAELVEPFAGEASWRNRLRYLMEGRNLDKSRRYFDLFLRLLESGVLDDAKSRLAVNGTFWSMMHSFPEKRPAWCAELAAAWIERKLKAAREVDPDASAYSLLSDEFGGEYIVKSAEGDPEAFLEHVLPMVLRLAAEFAYDEDIRFQRDELWPTRYQSKYLDLSESYLIGCEKALKSIGKNSPDAIRPYIEVLKGARLYTANHLLMSAYSCAPEIFADEVLQLLVNDADRLYCGYSDNAFWLSRRVIKACSPHCSEQVFGDLESVLLNFVSPRERTKD